MFRKRLQLLSRIANLHWSADRINHAFDGPLNVDEDCTIASSLGSKRLPGLITAINLKLYERFTERRFRINETLCCTPN